MDSNITQQFSIETIPIQIQGINEITRISISYAKLDDSYTSHGTHDTEPTTLEELTAEQYFSDDVFLESYISGYVENNALNGIPLFSMETGYGEIRQLYDGPVIIERVVARGDDQDHNMHDSSITIQMKKACQLLKEQTHNQAIITQQEIIQQILQLSNQQQIMKSIRVLGFIFDKNLYCESYQLSEPSLLQLLYTKYVSDNNRQDIVNNLTSALCDMIDENDDMKCLMGRMTRIYEVFCLENHLIPSNYFEQEIANKCSVLSKQIDVSMMSEKEYTSYLIQSLQKDYSSENEKEQVQHIVSKWFN